MPTSGDIVEVDLGAPTGQEAGFRRPAVLVTAQELLDQNPSVIQVVPLTSSIRGFGSELVIEARYSQWARSGLGGAMPPDSSRISSAGSNRTGQRRSRRSSPHT